MSRRVLAPLAAVLLSPLFPFPALATEVTAAEFESLVDAAATDPGALEELRGVTAVDGRSVDLEPVVSGASEDELQARLDALSVDVQGSDPSAARSTASEILSDRRFREPDPPRPLKGVTDWLDDRFGGVVRSIESFFTRSIPGGMVVFWLLVTLVVVIIALVLAGRASGRGARLRGVTIGTNGGEDPAYLEHEADRAERDGDLETSLRLRFRAGILRLAERGALPRRSSLTSEEIGNYLRSPTFDRLAATFDRVVYGRQQATPRDTDEAKTGWRDLSREVRA